MSGRIGYEAVLKADAASWIGKAMNDSLNGGQVDCGTGLALVARLTIGEGPQRSAFLSSRCQVAILDSGADRWKLYAHGAAYEWSEADALRVQVEGRGARVRFLPLP